MPNKVSKMQSWQIFHFARKHLGRSCLYGIFGRTNARAVDYWCEDPRYTTKSEEAYDPIRGTKALLESLDDQGHCGIVRSCISFLISETTIADKSQPEIVSPKNTITEEILADFSAVSDLQRAIEASTDVGTIEQYKRAAIAEIERTVAKYRENRRIGDLGR